MTCGFIVTPNQVKPFFSASLNGPLHNTANARDLAANPERILLVDIEEAAKACILPMAQHSSHP